MKKTPLFLLVVCRICLLLSCSYYTNICCCFIVVMKSLLFPGWILLAVSCVLASCSNDGLATVVAKEKEEVIMAARLGVDSCCALESENLYFYDAVYGTETGTVVAKNVKGVPVGMEAPLEHADIKRQALVFTAGRAWLNRDEVNSATALF